MRDPPYRPDHSRAKENRKGQEIGGLVPRITLKSIANTEPPAMEVLVDRPEEASEVARVPGPFALEATIAPVQPLEPAPHRVREIPRGYRDGRIKASMQDGNYFKQLTSTSAWNRWGGA